MEGKAVNGGYFWIVIFIISIFSVLYISAFFKFPRTTMYYFIIQKNTGYLKILLM